MIKKGLTASQYLYSLLEFFENGGGGGGGGGGGDIDIAPIGDETATGDAARNPDGAGTVIQFLKGVLEANQSTANSLAEPLATYTTAIGDETATGDAKTDPADSGTVLQFLKGLLQNGQSIDSKLDPLDTPLSSLDEKLDKLVNGQGTATWTGQETVSGPTAKPTLGTDGWSVIGSDSAFVGVFLGTATSVDFKIWCYVDGEWGVPRHGTFSEQTDSYLERTNVEAVERIFLQVLATDGDVTLKLAPVLLVPLQ